MRKHTKLMLAALGVTMLLGAATNAADARNLRTSEKNFELIWDEVFPGKTAFRFTPESGGSVTCTLALSGSFTESTIAKAAGQIGTISSANVGLCKEGAQSVLRETLPWKLRYAGFSGTLPTITALRVSVVGATFRLRAPNGLECLWGVIDRIPLAGEIDAFGTGGTPENIRVDETVTIPLNGGFLCELRGFARLSGTALLRIPTSKITITLI